MEHPHRAELRRVIDCAFRVDWTRAGLDSWDLPFGVALTTDGTLSVLRHTDEVEPEGLIEDVESRLLSLRPVLRACARCWHVELAVGAQRVGALRVQLEHVAGPPLDVYLPLADDEGWWVEAGGSFVFRSG